MDREIDRCLGKERAHATGIWQIYDCLVNQHDYRLVVVAALVCVLGPSRPSPSPIARSMRRPGPTSGWRLGAVRLELGLWDGELSSGISREALAGLVVLIVTMLLSMGLASALFDRRHSSELQAQAERFRILSDSALEGLIVHRDGQLIDTNAAVRRALSLSGDMTSRSIFGWFGSADRSEIERWLLQRSEDPVEIEMTALDGSRFPAEVSGKFIELADGSRGQVLAFRNITARKMAEAQLHHQALHDPLIDLPNRRLFHELARGEGPLEHGPSARPASPSG